MSVRCSRFVVMTNKSKLDSNRHRRVWHKNAHELLSDRNRNSAFRFELGSEWGTLSVTSVGEVTWDGDGGKGQVPVMCLALWKLLYFASVNDCENRRKGSKKFIYKWISTIKFRLLRATIFDFIRPTEICKTQLTPQHPERNSWVLYKYSFELGKKAISSRIKTLSVKAPVVCIDSLIKLNIE